MGDALLAAAFVSYAGPFNMAFRQRLVQEKWLPDLAERAIPITPGVMPLDVLTSDAKKVNASQPVSLHYITEAFKTINTMIETSRHTECWHVRWGCKTG